MEDCGLDEENYQTSDDGDYLPAQIVAVFRVLEERYPGRTSIGLLDELLGQDCPETEDGSRHDWSGLSSLGPDTHLRAAFNPLTALPLLLPTGPACLTVTCLLRYRQTGNLTKLVDCVNRTLGIKTVAGQSATDVSGPVPLWVDLGQEAGRLEEAVDLVTGPMEGAVTVLYDRGLSPASVEVLEKMAGEREGWQVRRVGD